jgi:hypothetical protein
MPAVARNLNLFAPSVFTELAAILVSAWGTHTQGRCAHFFLFSVATTTSLMMIIDSRVGVQSYES